MKTTLHILALVLLFVSQTAQAQDQALIDPVVDGNAQSTESFINIRYYYFPNLQAYFDTRTALYLYKENGSWTTSETIDPTLRGYSTKNKMYVMIKGFLGDDPTVLLESNKKEYPADYSTKRKPPVVIVCPAKTKKSIAIAVN